jgi:shikimate kinase
MPSQPAENTLASKDAEAGPAHGLARSIVLVGLMGAGKSSVGRLLAERLGLAFLDADAEIERAAGATIEEIFAHEGEEIFRSGERRVIARLLAGTPAVIATGGGAFMDAATRAAIRERGISVWLKADLETLVGRTARRGGRPLLKQGDPREILARLIDQRYPVYAEADLTIETGEAPAETVADSIVSALEAHLGNGPLAVRPKRAARGKSRKNGLRRRKTARGKRK